MCSLESLQHTAAVAEGDADDLRRELEKSNRRHAKEVASLQQRLQNSSSAVCSRCADMDDKKWGDDGDCVQPETAIVLRVGKTTSGVSESLSSATKLSEFSNSTRVYESWDADATIHRKGTDDSEFEEDDYEIVTPSVRFSRSQYENLSNLEIDFEDDDGFLCEQCGQPATNGMRVCDSCI